MKILFNLATLKEGGGQNVGLNFVKCLILNNYDLSKFVFVVSSGSSIEEELLSIGKIDVVIAPRHPLKRMIFELINGYTIIKTHEIDVIYTLFGIGLYPKKCIQISGSADSNIFFPEIDFWEGYKGFSRFKKYLVDRYRIYALKRAHAVIFENEAMLEKSKELFHLKNVLFSYPSINASFPSEAINFPSINSNVKIGLFLCGWQKNKNFMIIPEILYEFKNRGFNFHIVMTAGKSRQKICRDFMVKIYKFGVEDFVTILDPIKKTQLKNLYNHVDYVFLLSKLESFSNNIIEAWHFKKILVVSDMIWSRSICKGGALYVDRNNPKVIVEKIFSLEESYNKKHSILSEGDKILKSFPTMKEKIDFELNYIRSLYESI